MTIGCDCHTQSDTPPIKRGVSELSLDALWLSGRKCSTSQPASFGKLFLGEASYHARIPAALRLPCRRGPCGPSRLCSSRALYQQSLAFLASLPDTWGKKPSRRWVLQLQLFQLSHLSRPSCPCLPFPGPGNQGAPRHPLLHLAQIPSPSTGAMVIG